MFGASSNLDKKRIWQFVLIAVLFIAVITTIIVDSTKKEGMKISRVGDPIPAIELIDMEGKKVTLQAGGPTASAPMLINLWASWCKPCINEMPLLNEAQAFAPEVTFVAINMQETVDKIEPFIERYDLSMLILRDEHLSWKSAIAAQGYPVTVLVDEHGIIQHIHRGEYTSMEEILQQTSKLVAGEAISS